MSCRRLDELDALRGVALGMMLLSNFVSDLDFFGAMTVAAGGRSSIPGQLLWREEVGPQVVAD